jgi:hypothetical protein
MSAWQGAVRLSLAPKNPHFAGVSCGLHAARRLRACNDSMRRLKKAAHLPISV